MNRLSMFLGVIALGAVLFAPSAVAAATPAVPTAPSATGTPAAGQPPVVPAPEESSSAQDALIISGFAIVVMVGLVLILRAGLASAGNEDDD